MAAADDVISIPALRDALGGVGDTEDGRLTSLRSAAIGHIERWTNRCIIDKTGWETAPGDLKTTLPPVTWIAFEASDVKEGDFVLRYSPPGEDASFTPTATETLTLPSTRVKGFVDRIVILPPAGRYWKEVLRLEYPTPLVVVDRGMSAADIPPQWGEACALIVRALYDGSAYDNLASNSALNLLLSPWRPVPGGTRR